MSYELRRISDVDKGDFLRCGLKSPFGTSHIGFGRYIVENITENVKMAYIGGQGILTEEGEEWSDMAEYCALLWEKKSYLIEFYSRSETVEKKKNYDVFRIIYKIKCIHSQQYDKELREELIKKLKECFIAYNTKRYKSSICEKVSFMDTEVRWG